jgi:hypothetical protein
VRFLQQDLGATMAFDLLDEAPVRAREILGAGPHFFLEEQARVVQHLVAAPAHDQKPVSRPVNARPLPSTASWSQLGCGIVLAHAGCDSSVHWRSAMRSQCRRATLPDSARDELVADARLDDRISSVGVQRSAGLAAASGSKSSTVSSWMPIWSSAIWNSEATSIVAATMPRTLPES